MKVAITGGIGSGKSFVCKMLERRGLSIYDCDKAAKRIMASSELVKDSLLSTVGPDVYINGVLNKSVLSSFLLKSEENAKKINAIVHPAVAQDFISSGLNWMECAILFTSGFDQLVDKIICVTAPTDIRIERVMTRDSLSYERASMWIDCQMPQSEIVKLCDYEIINDGKASLDEQIDKILNSINCQKEKEINQ